MSEVKQKVLRPGLMGEVKNARWISEKWGKVLSYPHAEKCAVSFSGGYVERISVDRLTPIKKETL